MILTQLPDLPPRPLTPKNAAFRREFYQRWGKENAIVSGASHHAEYGVYRQTLSIKMVSGGSEHYYVERRRVTVTDETYLVLNEHREYASVLEGPGDAYSFCLFFRPGMAQDVARASSMSFEQALEAEGERAPLPVEFNENLQPHDTLVTPVMRFIRRHVESGVVDADWYEEQFQYLLGRLVRAQTGLALASERIQCVRASKRKELLKRIGWATHYMHSNLHRALTLTEIARAARISDFHFLRLFRQVHGVTPMTYLRDQRTRRALGLLASSPLEICEIANLVGMSRMTLWRAVKNLRGAGPQRLRQLAEAT